MRTVAACAGCGYPGAGVPYFSRSGHAFLLALVTIFTYGAGGLVYWLLRRNVLVCPSCGTGWDRARSMASIPRTGLHPAVRPPTSVDSSDALPRGGGLRRALGVVAVVGSLIVAVIAIATSELELLFAILPVGLLGIGLHTWGRVAGTERREALLRLMQGRVLQLAHTRNGALTVTDVASALQLTLPGAERLLTSMDDGFRVRSDVTRDGLIVFSFPEIAARSPDARDPGSSRLTPRSDGGGVRGLGQRPTAS